MGDLGSQALPPLTFGEEWRRLATISLMARMGRSVAVGYLFHITQWGNSRRNVFLDE